MDNILLNAMIAGILICMPMPGPVPVPQEAPEYRMIEEKIPRGKVR